MYLIENELCGGSESEGKNTENFVENQENSVPGTEFLEESNGSLKTHPKLVYNPIYLIEFTYRV